MTTSPLAEASTWSPQSPDRDPMRLSAEDHVLGSVAAPVKVVLYGDLTCPLSARAFDAVLESARQHPCVAAGFRHLFPVGDPTAHRAAMAAEAAGQLGAFWPFIRRVFSSGADPSSLRAHFAHLGLDEGSLLGYVLEARGAERLDGDRTLASRCAATSAAVFINGVRWHPHRSSLLLDDLSRLVERTRSLWDLHLVPPIEHAAAS